MNKALLKKTVKLWQQVIEEDLLEDVEPEVGLGIHYAKLALDGTVELSESGEEKVAAAYEALTELLGEED